MTERPRLAPHDAELVEADARAIYARSQHPLSADLAIPWSDLPDYVKEIFRRFAANPYYGGRP